MIITKVYNYESNSTAATSVRLLWCMTAMESAKTNIWKHCLDVTN